MKTRILFLLFLSISFCGFAQKKGSIEVKVYAKSVDNLIGGIVPVNLVIENNTKREIITSMAYPDPSDLRFSSESFNVKNIYEERFMIDERAALFTIPPGESVKFVFFLNRYFDFVRTGIADISYTFVLHTSTKKKSKRESHEYSGKVVLRLQNPSSDEELKKQYQYYSDNLKSNDRQQRNEAAEALSFVTNPLCFDYIVPMLSIDGLEQKGIRALSRFNTNESQQLILGMLSHRSFFVVQTAIQTLHSMGVEIPRAYYVKMLSSTELSVIWVGLEYLSKNPDVSDEEHIVSLINELQKDPSLAGYHSQAIEEAQQYLSTLKKLKK
jgi:hypothetical protein